jgi:DNA end-binding protein Ku
MRDKQHLGCLRVREGVITLEKMYFADEVRPIDEIKVKGIRVGKRELEMGRELIDRFAGSFDIAKYHDDYREALLRLIEAKRQGKEAHVERPSERPVPDLMEALRASLEEHTGRHRSGNGHSPRRDLGALSKGELEKRAKRQGVRGYSKMTKRELVQALDSD